MDVKVLHTVCALITHKGYSLHVDILYTLLICWITMPGHTFNINTLHNLLGMWYLMSNSFSAWDTLLILLRLWYPVSGNPHAWMCSWLYSGSLSLYWAYTHPHNHMDALFTLIRALMLYSDTLYHGFLPHSTHCNYYVALPYLMLLYFNFSVIEGQGNKYSYNCNFNLPVNNFSYIIFPLIWISCSYIWLFFYSVVFLSGIDV